MKLFDKNKESVTRILVTNDDGIASVGLACLVKALSTLPETEVYVSVPAVQQSGMSHATSLKSHTHVEEVKMEGAVQAFTVDSTPSDSCLFGLELFNREGIHPDVVISGINHGFNTAEDTHYSGTVGAAMEGVMDGIPAIAISTERFPFVDRPYQPSDFESACAAVLQFLPYALKAGTDFMYNINVANVPPSEIKGWRATAVGHVHYELQMKDERVDEKSFDRWYENPSRTMGNSETHPGTDTAALIDGYVSVTPIRRDWTGYEKIPELQALVEGWTLGE